MNKFRSTRNTRQRVILSNKIKQLESQDEWVASDSTAKQLDTAKEQKELVNLVIGYKRYRMEVEENAQKKAELTAKLKALKESQKSPEDKIKELEAELSAMSETETLVQKHMRLLGISEEEAKALIEADKAIDKGEKMDFDLTPEQAKNAKKYAKTGTKKPTVYKFDTEKAKNRKKDDEKGEFISKIAEFIGKFVQNVEIVNAEREISFEIGENSYSLTLTKHRKPKK